MYLENSPKKKIKNNIKNKIKNSRLFKSLKLIKKFFDCPNKIRFINQME